MEFFSYLFRFLTVRSHKLYFITLYRSAILLGHYFGLEMMFKSIFKPLFGMTGFISRINGLVIRSLAICLSIAIIFWYILMGIGIYIASYPVLYRLIFTKPMYVVAFLAVAFLVAGYNYYFHSPVSIGNKRLKANWNTKVLYFLVRKGNSKPLLQSFSNSSDVKELLLRAELPYEDTFKFIDLNINDFDVERFNHKILELKDNEIFVDNRLYTSDLFLAYFLQITTSISHLNKHRSDEKSLIDTLKLTHFLKSHEPQIWEDDFKIPPSGGIDKGWAIAYTPNINRAGTDLTKLALKGDLPRLIGRKDVQDSIISVLSKPSSNNVLLVGEAGSGKSTFVKALAREIALGTSIPALKHKRIISIDIGALTSGKSADISKVTNNIAREAEISGNIILFVDEIHNLATLSSSDPNASVVFAILEPFLSSAKFQFIGTTSYDNYLKYIKPNDSFARTFDVIELRPTTDEETMLIMADYIKRIEPTSKLKYTYPSLKAVLESGKRYVNDRALPDKALSLLSQSYSGGKGSDKVISREDILEFVSRRFHVPAQAINSNEKQLLLNIETNMKNKIIGQGQAIVLISRALKRARAGIRNENKPIASFLFAGPTGVGKTETAKVLAEMYFGDKTRMVRVDMSEYQNPDSVNRLIGDNAGQVGYLISKIQETPHTLILLDEIEKADKNVLNLFLQVLDDGRLTSSHGKTYDFTNSFIIMTTNVGTRAITKSISENNSSDKTSEIAVSELKAYFPIEFLNRFTSLIPYAPLSRSDMVEITKIKLEGLKNKMLEKKIDIEFPESVVNQTAELAFSPEWGARELNRIIEDKIETVIAEKIISGEINSGDTYKFDMIQ